MNLIKECTDNEIKLFNQAGIKIEDRDYTNAELNRYTTEIVEYILNHSSKNGEINKLQVQYDKLLKIIDVK